MLIVFLFIVSAHLRLSTPRNRWQWVSTDHAAGGVYPRELFEHSQDSRLFYNGLVKFIESNPRSGPELALVWPTEIPRWMIPRLTRMAELDLECETKYNPPTVETIQLEGRPLVQLTPVGNFTLRSVFPTNLKNSQVFTVHRDPTVVIKYQSHCALVDAYVHPSVREAIFLEDPESLGITQRVLFVSNSVALEKSLPIRIVDFRLHKFLTDQRCIVDVSTSIRYSVLSATGPSLLGYMLQAPGRRLSIDVASVIGRAMIHVLRDLHESGEVIHGNVDWNNICFRGRKTLSLDDLVLTNFEMAQRVVDVARKSSVRSVFEPRAVFASPWELYGSVSSRRDDVFRAVLATAFLMNGIKQYREFVDMTKLFSEIHRMKKEHNFFHFVRDDFGKRVPVTIAVNLGSDSQSGSINSHNQR